MESLGGELEERPLDELARLSPRVVVYGQIPYRIDPATGEQSGGFFSGAIEITDALSRYLDEHGMSDDGLVLSRRIDNIKNVFFGGRRSDRPASSAVADSIPAVVFVLPEMRGYYAGGHSVNTPISEIEALCEEHGVPMVVVSEKTTLEELNAALIQLSVNELPALNSGQPQS